jgi:hypothetical protein
VRNVLILVVAAGSLFTSTARPATAGSPGSSSDSVWTAESAVLRAPAAGADTAAEVAPSITGGAPSPAALGILRERVDRHEVRVFVGPNAYDARRVRFDAAGLSFAPGDLRGVPAWDNGGPHGDGTRPAPLASPVTWDRIDRMSLRKPCGLRGALIGAVVGAAVYAAIVGYTAIVESASISDEDLGFGVVLLLPLVPISAGLGAVVGTMHTRSELVWQRGGNPLHGERHE